MTIQDLSLMFCYCFIYKIHVLKDKKKKKKKKKTRKKEQLNKESWRYLFFLSFILINGYIENAISVCSNRSHSPVNISCRRMHKKEMYKVIHSNATKRRGKKGKEKNN